MDMSIGFRVQDFQAFWVVLGISYNLDLSLGGVLREHLFLKSMENSTQTRLLAHKA